MRKYIVMLCAAALMTLIALSGLLDDPANYLNDAVYQRERADSGSVVIVGIDARSAEILGPYYTWGRDVVASAIEVLNADADARPAVIGVDIVYAGYSDDAYDEYLVSAAGEYGNVVLACYGEYRSELVVEEGGGFYMTGGGDELRFVGVSEPFPELKAATAQGHINAMLDSDGVLRHALLYIETGDGERIDAFNRVIYEAYAAREGLPVNTPPTADNGLFYIPYAVKSGGFETFSLADVLLGEIPPEFFADKIVLIGPYDPALNDHVTASIDRGALMYGVEAQANLIEAQLSGEFKGEPGRTPQLVFLFAVTFLSLLFYRGRGVVASTVFFAGVAGAYVGLCLLLYEYGILLNILWIPLAAALCYVAGVAINYIRSTLEKRRVTNTFKRYVAPEIVAEILKEGADAVGLGGKLTDIAVLFVDIRGFTPMSEILPPERVVEILNRYLALTSACVRENRGTLDKFIGDATMAIWGAPLPQEDHVFKAVKAAWAMTERSRALNDELLADYGRSLRFGIGIHCGEAVVGNIGSPERLDYTAIGDTVNTAARLESNARPGQILISRAVADALGGRIRATSLGASIPLKGKSEGFEVLTLDGITEEAASAEDAARENGGMDRADEG